MTYRISFFLLLLAFSGMFFSCSRDNVEDIPSPGLIILGEQESDMEAYTVVNSGGTDFDIYDFNIQGPQRIFRFKIGTTYDHGASSAYYYNNRNFFLECTDPQIEFLSVVKTEGIMECETWSADSISEQTFTYFNEGNAQDCNGNLSFFDNMTYNLATLLPAGTRVDGQMAFQEASYLEISKSINSTSVSYDGQTNHSTINFKQYGHHNESAPLFLAFRMHQGQGEYKYGYVGLEIGSYGSGRVVSCAYER